MQLVPHKLDDGVSNKMWVQFPFMNRFLKFMCNIVNKFPGVKNPTHFNTDY